MVRITIDDELKQKLLAAGEVVELVDESGRLLGTIMPQSSARLEKSGEAWVPVTPELSEAELERLGDAEGPTTSSDDLLDQLRAKL